MSRLLTLLLSCTFVLACSNEPRDARVDRDADSPGPDAASDVDGGPLEPPSDGGPDADGTGDADAASGDASADAGATTGLFGSGSRLRARGYRADGALLAAVTLHDSELDVPCRYRTGADGALYCMPDVEESFLGYGSTFSDADCSALALVKRADCPAPARFHLLTESGCTSTTHVLRVGAASTPSTWYSRELEGCVAHTLMPGQVLYPIGDGLLPSQLVRGTERASSGHGLVRSVLVGDDGSWLTLGMRHTTDGACAPLWLGGNDGLRCVPSERAYLGDESWFGDATCSQPVAFARMPVEQCKAPEIAVQSDFAALSCLVGGQRAHLFELGPLVSDVYLRDFDNVCSDAPASTESSYAFYGKGAARSAQQLPQLSIAPLAPGRIRPYAYHGAEGVPLGFVSAENHDYPLLFDALLDTPCVAIAAGEELVCAPPRAILTYADADCQQPLLEVFEGEDCPLGAPKLVGVRGAQPDSCGQQLPSTSITVYRPGAPVAKPGVRRIRFQGACVPADSPAIRARYFSLGEQLPASMLARLHLAIE